MVMKKYEHIEQLLKQIARLGNLHQCSLHHPHFSILYKFFQLVFVVNPLSVTLTFFLLKSPSSATGTRDIDKILGASLSPIALSRVHLLLNQIY